MLYSILRFRFSIRFSLSLSLSSSFDSPPESLILLSSSFACKVAREIGRNLYSLAKSSLRVISTELLPDPKGPVRAMFLMCSFSAEDRASFNSMTDLYEASDFSSFLGSKVSIAISVLSYQIS